MEKIKEILKWIKTNFFDILIFLVMFMIIFNGRNIFYYIKDTLIKLFIIIPILNMIIKRKKLLVFNYINKIWIAIGLYLLIGLVYSYSRNITLEYLTPILVGIVFILFKINKDVYKKLMDFVLVGSIIFAISNILSTIIPEFIPRFCGFFVKLSESIYIELAGNNYSGLAGEKAVSAFILNLGIGIIYSKIMSKGKISKFDFIGLIILFFGIFLTGKRTLIVIPIAILAIMFVLSNAKNKTKKILIFIIVFSVIIGILALFLPAVQHVFERFYTAGLNGRGKLWKNCLIMFKESPILGQGFGTFNEYNEDLGYTKYGKVWSYEAHNIYFQVLGETGIIGSVLILAALLLSVIKSVQLLKKDIEIKDKMLIYFSLYIQLLFIIYGFTGNTLYYWNQFLIYMMSVSILNTIQIKEIKEDEKEAVLSLPEE